MEDLIWKNCLKMWKYVARNIKSQLKKEGFDYISPDFKPDFSYYYVVSDCVISLKDKWLVDNYSDSLLAECFFCEAAYSRCKLDNRKHGICYYCPGRIVNSKFQCQNERYAWDKRPIEFYKELCRLNKLRLEKNE